MSITVLPTKTIGSLGPVKTDTRAYLRPGSDLPAVELEKIKDAIVDLAIEVGLTDGTTQGSLREASGGGSPNIDLGALLWEWNGADLTQFDATLKDFERSGGSPDGGNADTAIVVTVVPDPAAYFQGNVLRFTCTGLQGGGILAVAASELTLPARYVLYCRVRGAVSGATLPAAGPMVHFADAAGDIEGFMVERGEGANNVNGRAIVNDLVGSSVSYASSGMFNSLCISVGGVVLLCTVWKRPEGEATALSCVSVLDRAMNGSDSDGGIAFQTELPHNISGVGTNWDNRDHNRFGLSVWENINGTTGTLDFKEFRIYAHPDD